MKRAAAGVVEKNFAAGQSSNFGKISIRYLTMQTAEYTDTKYDIMAKKRGVVFEKSNCYWNYRSRWRILGAVTSIERV